MLKIHTSTRAAAKFVTRANSAASARSAASRSPNAAGYEGRGHSGVDRARREEHQAEMTQRMQQQNGLQHGARRQRRELWQDIELGRDPEHKRAEHKIDGEDVHGFASELG